MRPVIIGVDDSGKKHLVALEDGVRESTKSWREVLLDLKSRWMNFPALARSYHDRAIMRGLDIVERIIRHGIARGEFAVTAPRDACRTVVGGVLFGAIWKMVFEPVGAEPIDPGELARVHAETILNGLRTRSNAS